MTRSNAGIVGRNRWWNSKELFALAGVDLTSPQPVEKTFGALAGMVARLEELAGYEGGNGKYDNNTLAR